MSRQAPELHKTGFCAPEAAEGLGWRGWQIMSELSAVPSWLQRSGSGQGTVYTQQEKPAQGNGTQPWSRFRQWW